jgi:hypothetical protein
MGHRRVRRHSADPGELVRCENTSETPTNPDKVHWGWLCPTCANEPSKGAPPLQEAFNASATQCDPDEFRDAIASGFAHGASRDYGDDDES